MNRRDFLARSGRATLVLGAAGLLEGYRSACHWIWLPFLARFGAVPVAERIVRELKDKVGAVALGPAGATPVAAAGVAQDAVSALLNLGFRPAEANAAVGAAEEELGTDASLDALVRLALRKAAK